MEIFSKLEGWDYLAVAMALFSLWLLFGGISRLQEADSEHVDVKKLKVRAWGGLIAAVLYLICRFYVIQ